MQIKKMLKGTIAITLIALSVVGIQVWASGGYKIPYYFPSITTTSTTATTTFSTGGLTVGTSQFVVQQNSGNVGIGTAVPQQKLDVSVSNSGGVGGIIQITNPASSVSGNAVELRFGPNSMSSTRYAAIQGVDIDPGNNKIGLAFITGTAGTITEKMRIINNGDVGIGTSTPEYKLDVNGDARLISTDEVGGTNSLYLSTYEKNESGEVLRIGYDAIDAKVGIAFQDWDNNSKAWLFAHKYLSYDEATPIKTFVDANVNTTLYQITITTHGFTTEDGAWFYSTGYLPTGIAWQKKYYVRAVDADTIALYYTAADATADTNRVKITAASGGGTHTMDGNDTHNHFSIETTDISGQLQTRMSFPFDRDTSVINVSSAHFQITNKNLYISGVNSNDKQLIFGLGETSPEQRWIISADNTTESGSNVGSDFRINRYNDTGVLQDVPIFIERSTGYVGIGNTSPLAKLDILSANVTPGNSTKGILNIASNDAQGINKGGSITLGGYRDDDATAFRVWGSIVGGKTNAVTADSSGYLAFSTNNAGAFGERIRIINTGNVGIGTTTPTTQLQVTTLSTNATSTLTVGKASQNKGSCLELFDAVGTAQYVSIISGVLTVSTTSCK